jgi:S-adenosylmethionine decarboxylase
VQQIRLGRQILSELTFCDPTAIDDEALLRRLLAHAAEESGATLLSIHIHRFQPHGLSGVAILAESHFAVHTWPEMSYVAVDVFTCGDHVDPAKAVRVLEEGFGARCTAQMEMNRGVNQSLQILNRLADSDAGDPSLESQ